MKVAYVLPTLQRPSGWRTYCRGAVNALAAHVDPVLFVERASLEDARALFPGLPIHPLPAIQTAMLSSANGLRALFTTWLALRRATLPSVDLVHSLEAWPTALIGSWIARRSGSPHIITAVGTYSILAYAYPLDRPVYEGVLRRAAHIYPISHGAAAILHQHAGPLAAPDRVQPILIGSDAAAHVPAHLAQEHSLPTTPTLLSVGDIKARKGQHISLAAFARLKQRFPEARYRLIGRHKPNTYYRILQDYIAEQGLTGVEFLGVVSDAELRRAYQEASLFVLTPQQDGYHFEGFGLVYLEAGAYGLPVVATRSGGVPDAVRHGETGLLAEPEDIPGLTAHMTRLLTNPALAQQFGLANRRWAESLTWSRYAAEQYAAYRAVLAHSAPRHA